MEGRGGNSFYENLVNINSNSITHWLNPPLSHHQPLTPIDKFLFSQASNNFSNHQNLYNLHQDQEFPLFYSNVFCAGGDHSHDSCMEEVSHFSNANALLLLDHHNEAATLTSDDQISTNPDSVNLDSQCLISPSESNPENIDGSSSSRPLWVKGQWTSEEDRKLVDLVKKYGFRRWSAIATHMTGRIGKQCRERWQNHLRPDIKKDHWTEEEERLLIEAHEKVGNRWAEIAKCLPGRTENSIKNHWNATKRKQLSKRKIRRPEALDGVKFSQVLEDYIKKKYFNKGSTSNNSNSGDSSFVSPPDSNPNETPSNIYEDDSISYLTFETYEEEMNFMTKLFGNNDDSTLNKGQVMSSLNINAPENTFHSSNYSSITTQMLNVQPPAENMVNRLLPSFYGPDMERTGSCVDMSQKEDGDSFSSPEIYLSSSMFEESNLESSIQTWL